jgi:phosphatidyl-myo-inositol alpha-mannosyltransferase
VLHLHSPETLSLSLLALMNARGPIVATFHAANPRSRVLAMLQSPLQVHIEKIIGRIAVSPAARKTIVEHLGADAVVIPNGVYVDRYASAAPLDGWPGAGGALGFVGRIDEPRKGLAVLLDALPAVAAALPEVRLLVAGPGEVSEVAAGIDPALRRHVRLLGLVSDADKPRLFRTADVYVAPNTGQESFGIVLLEAMAARTPVVASNIDAFRRVLDDGRAGRLFANSDPADLARVLIEVLTSRDLREELAETGWKAVQQYDWSTVATEIVHVYETVTEDPGRRWL